VAGVPDGALVVRGGLQQTEDLVEAARSCLARHEFYGLSVWAGLELTVAELCKVGNILHGIISIGVGWQFRANGFEIEYTGPQHHATVYLGDSIDDEGIWDRFRGSFVLQVPNPL
jgi:hypothetical protein